MGLSDDERMDKIKSLSCAEMIRVEREKMFSAIGKAMLEFTKATGLIIEGIDFDTVKGEYIFFTAETTIRST